MLLSFFFFFLLFRFVFLATFELRRPDQEGASKLILLFMGSASHSLKPTTHLRNRRTVSEIERGEPTAETDQ